MNEIAIYDELSEAQIDENDYFQSLLLAAQGMGLINENEMKLVQEAMLGVLSSLAKEYTGGRSASVRNEVFHELFLSLCFTLGVELKECNSHSKALMRIKSESISALFEKGQEKIKKRILICRHLHRQICSGLFKTPNEFYRSTVVDGIAGFFKLYKPRLFAHETHITADYPTLLCRPSSSGIEFIEQYLMQIKAENSFCKLFESDEVHKLLLCGNEHYAETPMNIFEQVLLCALALTMIKKDSRSLFLEEEDKNELFTLCKGKEKSELSSLLHESISILSNELALDERTKQYINLCEPLLLQNFLQNNTQPHKIIT